jgi:hypothetical protein
MKRSSRFLITVFLIGLSLLLVTVIRMNSAPHTMNFGNENEGATAGWTMYSDFLMFPRDFTVDIRANNTVNVYILDEADAKQWNTTHTLDATWSYDGITQGQFSEHDDSRGAYAILTDLPPDRATTIKVTLTFSGFEKDLLTLSLAIIAADIMAFGALLLINRRKRKE